jgi:hypothetical protein
MFGKFSLIYLAWYGMRLAHLIAPISTAHRDDGELGQDDGSSNSGRYFFRAFDSETNVSILVTDSHKSLKK